MMADLVGDHVGLGELARGLEPLRELLVEGQVDVELLVGGAVERSDRGAGRAAALGPHLVAEQDESRFSILLARLREDLGPDVFGHGEGGLGQGRLPLFLRALRHRCSRLLLLSGRLLGLHPLEQRPRILAGQEAREQHDEDRAQPAAHRHPGRGDSPAILDVLALALILPTHVSLPWKVLPCARREYLRTQRCPLSMVFGRQGNAIGKLIGSLPGYGVDRTGEVREVRCERGPQAPEEPATRAGRWAD